VRCAHTLKERAADPFYNGSTDVSTMRLDILYGVKALDPRLATPISGTA
jgi:hypothetical protein